MGQVGWHLNPTPPTYLPTFLPIHPTIIYLSFYPPTEYMLTVAHLIALSSLYLPTYLPPAGLGLPLEPSRWYLPSSTSLPLELVMCYLWYWNGIYLECRIYGSLRRGR